MSNMKTHGQMRAELIGKAVEDEDFRAQLVADPKAAIQDVFGLTVPDPMSITVHEDSATTAHLVLPPATKLNDADLKVVAGGHDVRGVYGQEIPHPHPGGQPGWFGPRD